MKIATAAGVCTLLASFGGSASTASMMGSPAVASSAATRMKRFLPTINGVKDVTGSLVTSSALASKSPPRRLSDGCSGYFCDQFIDTMFILMTHNSAAWLGHTWSPNQNHDVGRQFDDGIRGFSIDLYSNVDQHGTCDYIKAAHGEIDLGMFGTHWSDLVKKFKGRLEARPDEFILIQLEDYVHTECLPSLVEWWGSMLITDFDPSLPLGHYLERGQQVLLLTDNGHNARPAMGIHDTHKFLSENNYQWHGEALYGRPDWSHRRGPNPPAAHPTKVALMMNYFCCGLGNTLASTALNQKGRVLYHTRDFLKQAWVEGQRLNVLMVDYYDIGSDHLLAAQGAIRNQDTPQGCWTDGELCLEGSSCYNCCANTDQWWHYHQSIGNRCGIEPCWPDGVVCLIGTTCDRCCHGFEGWTSKCGFSCWEHAIGTVCLPGLSCERCCIEGPWWQWHCD